jgi:hypothetical protein
LHAGYCDVLIRKVVLVSFCIHLAVSSKL